MTTVIQHPVKKNLASCGNWILILFGLLPVVLYLLVTAAGAVLIVGDPLRKSDVIVLLGGGDDKRMQEAARLYQDRYGTLLVLTETGEADPGSGILYSKLQAEQLQALGVPSGGITYTPQHGNSTYEEAKAVRKMFADDGRVNSIIIVTDPYHTMRTRLIYREIFRGAKMRVAIRPARDHWYRSTTWWMQREGWEMTISEYVKLFAYFAGVKSD